MLGNFLAVPYHGAMDLLVDAKLALGAVAVICIVAYLVFKNKSRSDG